MKLLRGKVPWIYTWYADIEPDGHLMAKDARLLECSFPYQTLLVKGNISFKEGEEAKAIPDGSNRLNEKIRDLEKEGICYFTDGSKVCNQEFVGFSCVTASEEIRHQYQATKFTSVFTGEAMAVLKTLEIISESQGESFYIHYLIGSIWTYLCSSKLKPRCHYERTYQYERRQKAVCCSLLSSTSSMGRSGDLSDFERGLFIGCHISKKSVRGIATLLRLPKSMVGDVIVKWKCESTTTMKPLQGRLRLMTGRDRRTLKMMVRETHQTSSETIPLSSTVLRIVQPSP
jgi:hypothetical protein